MGPYALLIDYARTLISLGMLGYASYKDIKTREIHDMVWIVPAGAGLLMDAYELLAGDITLQGLLFSVGFMVALSGILWYLSLFGEADLIAFITLAVLHPRTPLYDYVGYAPIFFSFTLIGNTAIAGLLMAFYTFAANIAENLRGTSLFERYSDISRLRKIAVMFTGRYVPLRSLRGPPFEYPLEVKGELIIKPDLIDDEKAKKAFRVLREKGLDHVWVSSTLPYIVVLLVGYIISVIFGDVMFTIMSMLV